jgi:hypothetical protein
LDNFLIRSIQASDRSWMSSFVESRWGSGIVVAKGRVIKPVELEGFAAFKGINPLGLVTYRIEGLDCEIVTIDSDIEDVGIGTALIDAVRKKAKAKGSGDSGS